MRLAALVLVAVLVCLSGCGVPGAPLPPSLGIPKAVDDLQAMRKGATVTLEWTDPTETTDGELIRKPGKVLVSRGTSPGGPFQTVREIPLEPPLKGKQRSRASATDNVSSLVTTPAAPDFLFYRVSTITGRGRISLPSNQAVVAAVATAPPPQELVLGLVPQGVTITFHLPKLPSEARLKSQIIYRIRRSQGEASGAEPVLVGQVRTADPGLPMIDNRIEWEKKYQYWVTPVTLWHSGSQQGEIEGDDSPRVTIVAHDTFPPATPSGLQAVFSGLIAQPAIDLTWTPNIEDDLAGYNVYRHSGSEAPLKINADLVKSSAFHDAHVRLGQSYSYSVSAVDLRGNESGRSAEASESVPRE